MAGRLRTLAATAVVAAVLGVLAAGVLAPQPQPHPQPAHPPAQPQATTFDLTLLHLGDTHSRLDPTEVPLRLEADGTHPARRVVAELGGFPQIMSAVAAQRAAHANTLFLHAGDLFQGSLYFTRYQGAADVDFWNLMGLDAATLGNHELDKGPAALSASLLTAARFPVLSANIDAAAEPALDAASIQPYVVLSVGGRRVGVIGLTTEETPHISSPGANLRFLDAEASVQQAADSLSRRGVDKIVLLSHQGYAADRKLAARVRGLDVIVGGHSHTRLGDFDRIGLAAYGRYPTEVNGADGGRILVAHAWEWGKMLGVLGVRFDTAGRVVSARGEPRVVVGKGMLRIHDVPDLAGRPQRIEARRDGRGVVSLFEFRGAAAVAVEGEQRAAYLKVYDDVLERLAAEPTVALVDPDPAGARKLASYAAGVAEQRGRVAAFAAEDLRRGLNRGPGPLVADSMAWRTGSTIALNNTGGVRTNLAQGPISVAAVYELLPFDNTLVTLTLSGAEVVKALEEAVDAQVSRYGPDANEPYVYVSGIAFTVDLRGGRGERVRDVRVRALGGDYAPIEASRSYSVTVNSFMAAGGDRYDSLKAATERNDTGFGDAEAFLDYIGGRSLTDTREQRVKVVR